MAEVYSPLNKEEMNEAEWARIKWECQNDIYDNPSERNEYGEMEDE